MALRSSANRPAGAEVIKPVSLDAEEYLHLMTGDSGILDLIKENVVVEGSKDCDSAFLPPRWEAQVCQLQFGLVSRCRRARMDMVFNDLEVWRGQE